MPALELAVQSLKHDGDRLSSSWRSSHIASLILRSNSLLRSNKFPVPPRREFSEFLQGFCRVVMAKTAHTSPSQRYFPVFSLHIREMRWKWPHALELYDEAKVVARQIDLLGLRAPMNT
jgi:hypothetical protein